MKNLSCALAGLALLICLLQGCGGAAGDLAGNDPGGGGIGGTGLTSSGTISGFGSIFVNGVEFDTDDADIVIDGERLGETALRLGMVVTVTGLVDDNGETGTASSVVFDNSLEGPVERITLRAQGEVILLEVFGVEVIVERSSTVFDQVTFDNLALGDLVSVSGFVGDGQRLQASRVAKTSDFVAGVSSIQLTGVATNLAGAEFSLGEYSVDTAAADLSALPGGALSQGLAVQVRGTLLGNQITADRVTPVGDIRRDLADNSQVSLQGAIRQFVDSGDFEINGVRIDAGNASLEPADLNLRNGRLVQVNGSWNGTVLTARSIRARRGLVAIKAAITTIDEAARSLTLQLHGGALTVQVDALTLIEDSTRLVDRIRFGNLSSGDVVAVTAFEAGDALRATNINRVDLPGDVLQARVESFIDGVELTLLGVSFNTQGAQFLGRGDPLVSAEEFYAQLQVGDLVRVRDTGIADGIADQVLFQLDDSLVR